MCCDAAAVISTAKLSFTATQRALGALAFMPMLAASQPAAGTVEDEAGCLRGGYTSFYLKDLYLREMAYAFAVSFFIFVLVFFPKAKPETIFCDASDHELCKYRTFAPRILLDHASC